MSADTFVGYVESVITMSVHAVIVRTLHKNELCQLGPQMPDDNFPPSLFIAG